MNTQEKCFRNWASSRAANRLCRLALGVAAVLAWTSPAATTPAPLNAPGSADADFFHSNRVVQVQVTIAPDDWEKLRKQERDVLAEFSKERLVRPVPKPYTWFRADVTIDGTLVTNVGIRKRGYFGSADLERPALNIEFDRFMKDRKYTRRSSLKLHNNKQDGTNLRQALAYRLFTAAGVPAPRCNLAHVTVNGTKLGVYSNLEAIDDSFLQRHFGSDQGNLYEAQISDFRPGWTQTFEKKNNPQTSRADLEAVAKALTGDQTQLLERLGPLLDLEAFYSFWAMESLINHWDGFAGDLNNCYVYHDPKSDKLRFIAWGADATFGPHHIFVPFAPSASVWAVSFLTRQLYNHPIAREKYRQRLRELLANVWNEKELLSEVDRMQALAKDWTKVPMFMAAGEFEGVRRFIRNRRAAVDAELGVAAMPWVHPQRREAHSAVVGKITADFSSTWVSSVFMPAPPSAQARINLDFYGRKYVGNFVEVKAAPDPFNPRNASLLLTGTFDGVAVPVSIWVSTSTNRFQSDATLKSGTAESTVTLMAGDLGKDDWRLLGFWGDGSIRLEEAVRKEGGKVQGQIQADITTIPWDDFDLKQLKKSL